jgi:hypothetical protein
MRYQFVSSAVEQCVGDESVSLLVSVLGLLEVIILQSLDAKFHRDVAEAPVEAKSKNK